MQSYVVIGYDAFGGTSPCYVQANSYNEAIKKARELYGYVGKTAYIR